MINPRLPIYRNLDRGAKQGGAEAIINNKRKWTIPSIAEGVIGCLPRWQPTCQLSS